MSHCLSVTRHGSGLTPFYFGGPFPEVGNYTLPFFFKASPRACAASALFLWAFPWWGNVSLVHSRGVICAKAQCPVQILSLLFIKNDLRAHTSSLNPPHLLSLDGPQACFLRTSTSLARPLIDFPFLLRSIEVGVGSGIRLVFTSMVLPSEVEASASSSSK